MKNYEVHPIADEFPMMPKERLETLANDIKTNGLREPIVIYEDKILDGRNRMAACNLAGVEPIFIDFTGGNPYDFIWSLNGERRDLTDDQRYLIWKSVSEKSEQWKARQRAIQEEANRKRSEAMQGVPYAPKGEPRKESSSTTSANTFSPPKPQPKIHHEKGQTAKAEASKTNRGAVARGDYLSSRSPELTEKVKAGKLTMTAALREVKKAELPEQPPLPSGKFRVLLADPPWHYGNSGLDGYGHAERHYPTMTIAQLCALPVRDIAEENSVLFLWVTSPLLGECWSIIKAWGFQYKTSFVWDKVKHNFGHYNSVRHELLLICTRGSCTPDNSQLFDSVQVVERSEKHSEKPEEFRTIIETLYPRGDKCELFARAKHEGWASFGNELQNDICGTSS